MRAIGLAMMTVLLLGAPSRAGEKEKPTPKVHVLLWFDTEDYLLPASDDAALQVAQMLTREGIRGTFKIVGHKARTLEKRKRLDVIEALKKHEIGYHSNWHSVQPTPAMYASNLEWDEGVAEFERREGKGKEDVERIFGVKPTCYGQPGSSWCPQSYAVLNRWGMIYLDAGRHVSLEGKPCYFGGILNLYQLTHTIRADLNKPDMLEQAKQRFAEARAQLLAEGGGLVSTVYHPCEWVHKKFWDGVNFGKGANPPPEKWVLPPQKTEEETRQSFRIFAEYVAFMKRFPDVEFITASEAGRLYADRARQRNFGKKELQAIAEGVGEEVSFQRHGDWTLSASEVFDVLVRFLSRRIDDKKTESVTWRTTPLGPTSKPVSMEEAITTDPSQFRRTLADVEDYLTRQGRIPSAVWLGSTPVPPEAFLRTAARLTLLSLEGKAWPEQIEITRARLGVEKHVSPDEPRLWGWVIFPPGFKAPHLMEVGRRQSWTLKPALLGRPASESGG